MAKSKVLLLKKNGTAKWLNAPHGTAEDGEDWYAMHPQKTYLDQRITGVRKLTVFVEGNPEPVCHADPVGLSSRDLQLLAGPLVSRLIAPAMGAQTKKPGLDLKWFLLVGVLVAGGFVGYLASSYMG